MIVFLVIDSLGKMDAAQSSQTTVFNLRIIDLKNQLKKRELDTTGTKTVLVERLKKAVTEEGHTPESYNFDVESENMKKESSDMSADSDNKATQEESEVGVEETKEAKNEETIILPDVEQEVINKNGANVQTESVEDTSNTECEEAQVDMNGSSDKSQEQLCDTSGISEEELLSSALPVQVEETEEGDKEEPMDVDEEPSFLIPKNVSTADRKEEDVSVLVYIDENIDIDSDIIGKGGMSRLPEVTTEDNGEKTSDESKTEENSTKVQATSSQDTAVPEKDDTHAKEVVASTGKEDKKAEDQEDVKLKSEEAKPKPAADLKANAEKANTESLPAVSNRNLWISGLSGTTRATDLKTLFSKYGKVVGAKVVTNARSPGSRCYGYVTMSAPEEASKCIQHLHRTELHGRMISVERAKRDPAATIKKSTTTPAVKKETVAQSPSKKEDKAKNEHSKDSETEKNKKTEDKNKRADTKGPNSSSTRRPSTRPHHNRRGSRDKQKDEEVLSLEKIKQERERERQRQIERRLRAAERQQHEDMLFEQQRQQKIRRRQAEEANKLQQEKEMLRMERDRLEREKMEAQRERAMLKREKRQRELERIQLEKQRQEEKQRSAASYRSAERRPYKRPYDRSPGRDHSDAKRSTSEIYYPGSSNKYEQDRSSRHHNAPASDYYNKPAHYRDSRQTDTRRDPPPHDYDKQDRRKPRDHDDRYDDRSTSHRYDDKYKNNPRGHDRADTRVHDPRGHNRADPRGHDRADPRSHDRGDDKPYSSVQHRTSSTREIMPHSPRRSTDSRDWKNERGMSSGRYSSSRDQPSSHGSNWHNTQSMSNPHQDDRTKSKPYNTDDTTSKMSSSWNTNDHGTSQQMSDRWPPATSTSSHTAIRSHTQTLPPSTHPAIGHSTNNEFMASAANILIGVGMSGQRAVQENRYDAYKNLQGGNVRRY